MKNIKVQYISINQALLQKTNNYTNYQTSTNKVNFVFDILNKKEHWHYNEKQHRFLVNIYKRY